MLKKITALVTSNKTSIIRRAAVLGGVTAGIAIGLMLNKSDASDVDVIVIEEETVDFDASEGATTSED